MEFIVETIDLTKKYKQQIVVDKLNLKILPGEIFSLLGPNGSGKTTILLMLLGLCEPDFGEVKVLGLDPLRDPLKIKRQVGYLPENVGFYGDLTAYENLAYIAELNKINKSCKREKILNTLKDVGLEKEVQKKVDHYSRGMRQRLGLAEVLIKEPKLIFLDEPTLGLDPDGINKMLDLIQKLSQQQGLSIILSSHLLHLVEKISNRVAILKKGRLMAQGSVKQLAQKTNKPEILEEIYLSFF